MGSNLFDTFTGVAAAAWLQLGQKDKALAAAKRSDQSPPEQRNDLLASFFGWV